MSLSRNIMSLLRNIFSLREILFLDSTVLCRDGSGSPGVTFWTSDQWVVGSNQFRGMFHH